MNQLSVIIRKRDGVLYEGQCYAVSSTNEIGPFDVLANHANFVCTIKDKIIIHITPKNKKDFQIETGVLRVKENKLEVYLGI